MSQSIDLGPILQMIHTSAQRDYVLHEINVLTEHLYSTKGESVRDNIRRYLTPHYASELIHLCDEAKISDTDTNAIKVMLNALTAGITAIGQLSLRVGFDPSDEDIKDLSQWIRYHIGIQVVLDVIHDPSVVGGAIMSFKGMYRDYSLSHKIEEMIIQQAQNGSALSS